MIREQKFHSEYYKTMTVLLQDTWTEIKLRMYLFL